MFDGLLTDYATTRGACAIVRGIRNTVDFDYELQMAGTNRHLAPAIDTMFLATVHRSTPTSARRSSATL